MRQLLLISFIISSPSFAEPFLAQVEQDLTSHAFDMQWPAFKHDIELWLPNKATDLPACDNTHSISRSNPSKAPLGRVNYLIQCPQPKWQLRAVAKVKVYLPVLHAKTEIARQQTLSASNSFYKTVDVSRLSQGFIAKPNNSEHFLPRLWQQVISKKRIRAGKAISPYQLQAAYLVSAGDTVIIRAKVDNFSATMKGKALQSGQRGDKIQVENLSSNKRIQAIVTESGVVETIF
ncbi:flagellar basal body P-ring formation chaperone FlgA [Thalassotalea sp. PLHSN55]|uniref:flagellar basal body P-ring formation chaperone FlgA n=1 Tax=Thalassotalea sp. PLHSN55 TaxID=3435888 RepID=UPI003F85CB24